LFAKLKHGAKKEKESFAPRLQPGGLRRAQRKTFLHRGFSPVIAESAIAKKGFSR
jgi:hypothetical protein